ncbi:hypothetical protein [Nonomuraea basaltis]|uniref:hypothetical protein n=1 Tax=Nonomuraea basaltis TaxID=2495887 RepID=UPI00197F127A|nr:hypothetical protein [Nonomuraea basaltis]
MTEFVLVAGAWLGAWAWDEVVPDLRAAGHGIHPLTLSGLAEKQRRPPSSACSTATSPATTRPGC